jgi:hypothetical protein
MSTSLNAQTSHLAGRFAATAAKHAGNNESDDETNDDDIFAELEAELEEESGAGMAQIREYSMGALKQE